MFEHLDLFSGIGGFAVAANDAGFTTVAFCESDLRCRTFLERTWRLSVEPDVRQLDGSKYAGISLLTGGPPCQPASRAGKQGGQGDDRWLWPEALRVLGEAKPDCVVFENPPGILDVGIDGILSEMGRLGYEVQPFDIPACAVDSPQLRHRIWIVGFLMGESNGQGHGKGQQRSTATRHGYSAESATIGSMANARREQSRENESERGSKRGTVNRRDCESKLADSRSERRQQIARGSHSYEKEDEGWTEEHDHKFDSDGESVMADAECFRRLKRSKFATVNTPPFGWARYARDVERREHWQNSVWVPCADGKLRRAPDDSFILVDGLHRSILSALGNSIVPQVAFEILRAVKEVLTESV